MNQVATPSRPRPMVEPPARPRPGSGDASITRNPVTVQPSLPVWQNGSAVFQAGYAGRVSAWVTPVEQQEGFLGRLHTEAGGITAAYAYVKATRSYRFVGRRSAHNDALALL